MSDEMTLFGSNRIFAEIRALPSEQRRAVTQLLLQEQQQEMMQELERSLQMERQERQQKEEALTNQITAVAEDLRKGIDAGVRRAKGLESYYTRTQIGKTLAPVVSAPRMTRLMRAAGIVSQYGDPLAKYRAGTEPLAKLKPFSEYEVWLFHVDKLTSRINRWLEENDLYSGFHNTATKNERDRFIDEIYHEFAGDLEREDKA